MSAYEQLFRGVLFPLYERWLRRRDTLRYLAEYQRNQWLSPERLADLQWQKLSALLRHCWVEVPYYRRVWTAAGATLDDIRGPRDFERLPLLTKADIRANYDELHARSHRDRMLYKSTSGSTGEPLRLGYTRESFERRIAVMWRGYEWAGSRMGRRTLYLWGAPVDGGLTAHAFKDRVYHRAFNRRILNTYLMSDANMAEYADQVDRFRPEVIVGYVNPIVRLAKWLLESGRRVHAPHSVLGAAEAMHPFQRELIERAFGCKAYNTYGCREFMLVASECEAQSGLHVSADHLVVELVHATPSTDGGTVGELAITDLHNYGMPFVRYLNGDSAVAAHGDCPCGRSLPRLAKVSGRTLDALHAADGRIVPGEFMPFVFNDIPGVLRFRVHQRSLDRLEISLVVDSAWSADGEQRARRQIGRVFGDATQVDFLLVDDLPLGPGGKTRVSVSDIG